MQSRNVAYLDKLDHLRFFAAAIVIEYHAGYWFPGYQPIPIFAHGYVGVSLFMVLSGMIFGIITYGKTIDPWRFYLNRVLRIYPLLVVVVALGYFSVPVPATIGDFLLALMPVSNVARLNYGPYGGVLFSTAIELQFYLLLPMLLGRKWLVGLVAFLILLRTMVWLLNGTVYELAYLSIFGSLDLFVIGLLAGNFYAGRLTSWKPRAWLLFLLLLGITEGLYWLDVGKDSALWIIWPTVQGIAFAALALIYLDAPWRCAPLAYLGKISYSLYVWHSIVFMLAVKYHQPLLVWPATIAISAASYKLIEEPFLSLRVRYVKTPESTPASS